MRTVVLTREPSEDVGTFGEFVTDNGQILNTGELPWRDNLPDKSCIPPGEYLCLWQYSPKHERNCYHVTGVPARGSIEIHSGNFCGDTDRGFKSDVLGCILPGLYVGALDGQKAVCQSREALLAFESNMAGQPFELTIK